MTYGTADLVFWQNKYRLGQVMSACNTFLTFIHAFPWKCLWLHIVVTFVLSPTYYKWS